VEESDYASKTCKYSYNKNYSLYQIWTLYYLSTTLFICYITVVSVCATTLNKIRFTSNLKADLIEIVLRSFCLLDVKIKIHGTMILPVVLYGWKIWSLTLREDHRLKVLENRLLRRIFGPKRDEVAEGWKKLHNERPS
jgi:hypothetical protein